eukprot:g47081.t1
MSRCSVWLGVLLVELFARGSFFVETISDPKAAEPTGNQSHRWISVTSNQPESKAIQPEQEGNQSVNTERLKVFSLDYHHVQVPFEITLWIMLASLAKI